MRGAFLGHPSGAFELHAGVFNEFVAALQSDPRFIAGADGVGTTPVIPFDYEHVSEMDPRTGNVAVLGAPAPAWVLDLKVTTDDAGKAQLWAYAQLGDRIREQMANNEYRFVSIAFVLDAVDPVTGEPSGPRLTSIAFTNHPFLRDLEPLAASAGGMSWYGDPAESPAQAFEFVRSILQLPAATTVDEVLAELGKVLAWAEAPSSAPSGLDLAAIVRGLRRAWFVPVTHLPADMFDMAKRAAAALATHPEPATTPAPLASELSRGATPMPGHHTSRPQRFINLAGVAGPNRTARLVDWIRENEPDGATLSWRELSDRAWSLAHDRTVSIMDPDRGTDPRVRASVQSAALSATYPKRLINLAGLPGANRTERVINWIRENERTSAQLNWAGLNNRAAQLVRDATVQVVDPYSPGT